jgi:hypothetical protein
MKSINPFRAWSVVVLLLAALVAAACGSIEPSPTSPSPTPAPGPSTTPAPAGGRLQVVVNPNPVPFSGQPITDSAGCANVPNTWFYDQVLTNTGGNTINVSDRADFFNDREVSKRSALGIVLSPGASTTIKTRWCTSQSGTQTAQTNWGATDTTTGTVLTITGPRVTLRAK